MVSRVLRDGVQFLINLLAAWPIMRIYTKKDSIASKNP